MIRPTPSTARWSPPTWRTRWTSAPPSKRARRMCRHSYSPAPRVTRPPQGKCSSPRFHSINSERRWLISAPGPAGTRLLTLCRTPFAGGLFRARFSGGLSTRFRKVFHLRRAPQVPTRHTAIRTPPLSVCHQLFRLGQLVEAMNLRKAFANSVVVHGQHVRTAEPEDQQHLHRPAANAAYGGQALD